MFIFIVLALILGVIVYTIADRIRKDRTVKAAYPGTTIVDSGNYYLICSEVPLLISKRKLRESIPLTSINELKVYENGTERSAGNAAIGAVAFGVVGALIGSGMRKFYVNTAGLKVYTSSGFYDLRFIATKTKRDGIVYETAMKNLDTAYNVLIQHKS